MGINCQFKRSSRAKHLRISVYLDGKVVVTVPTHVNNLKAEEFISAKEEWIRSKLEIFKNINRNFVPSSSEDKYMEFRNKAIEIATQRIAYFNNTYKYTFNRVTIRNQRTRWGSCSKKGNLNFNYKIALLPSELSDYIIVHELCHLKEFNHSKKFWELVAITVPNYLDLRKRMRSTA